MEDLALLRRIEFFKGLGTNELMQLNKITERDAVKAGEIVVKEGTPCEAFYVIKSGRVKVEKDGTKITELGGGDPIGEISFIDKGMRSATVTAIDDTVLIKIPSDPFEKFLLKENEISSKVYKAIATILCRRLRETNEFLKLHG